MTVLFGDCIDGLRTWATLGLRAQTCVTSPPYFGLRDYGHDGQIGLEQTPDEYIAKLVDVFRAVRDVLADDGTLWVNIGDSYCAPNGRSGGGTYGRGPNSVLGHMHAAQEKGIKRSFGDAKPKDLIGIPWLLAFSLRADGWYLRQDIIWHKPNPMPESVRDRCTKAHEYVFLLSKSERYFYDHEAVKEPAVSVHSGREPTRGEGYGAAKGNFNGRSPDRDGGFPHGETRNRRSVWTIATRPYKGAHFAVFPPALIEPCILAGSRPGDVVLDPFMGSGTTAAVAVQHGRLYAGCEINESYRPLIEARLKGTAL